MLTWVHTCPARDSEVEHTLHSVRMSDIGEAFEVRRHPEGLSDTEIEEWWEAQLLQSASDSEFFLRIEDDVFVCRSILDRVKNWEALKQPDFFLGSLFWSQETTDDEVNFERGDNGIRMRMESTLTAQALVFRSEHVKAVLEEAKEVRRSPYYYRMGRFDFDFILHKASSKLGLSVYQYDGSLVSHRDIPSANCPAAGVIAPKAHNFLED